MMTSPLYPKEDFSRRPLPRITWLEPEHYERAKIVSQDVDGENNQWKTYLNELALLGFEEWLKEQLPDIKIKQTGVNLQVDKFKVQLITVDNLIDDFVTISQDKISSPQLVAHFYVLVEVLEEIEQLRIHGLIRHDELTQIKKSNNYLTINDSVNRCYRIPHSCFDSQINNLLMYTRFLNYEAIPLPTIREKVIENLVNLGQWWNGVFEEGWQSLEEILTPQTPAFGYLKTATRRGNKSSDFAVRKGILFDFGLILCGQRFVLTVNMRFEENQEIGVLVQILPYNECCLPQGLKLKVTLNHNTNEPESEEAIAREYDQIIQLAFSEPSGKQFKVEAIYQDAVFTKEFAL